MFRSDVKNVLIVDDSIDMHELLTHILESKGYSVDCRKDGEEAFELLSAAPSAPDAILLDLKMPGMGGVEFLRRKKEIARLTDIPVILMTAEEDLTEIKDQFEIQQILSKPFSMGSVLSAVDRSTSLH